MREEGEEKESRIAFLSPLFTRSFDSLTSTDGLMSLLLLLVIIFSFSLEKETSDGCRMGDASHPFNVIDSIRMNNKKKKRLRTTTMERTGSGGGVRDPDEGGGAAAASASLHIVYEKSTSGREQDRRMDVSGSVFGVLLFW